MFGQDEWLRHPANRALDLSGAVDLDEIGRLPDAPGLYAIWKEDFGGDQRSALLYVGRSQPRDNNAGIRTRIAAYLYVSGTRRPNETLYLHLINHILRPDLSTDERNVTEIAVEFLRTCAWAGWAVDGSDPPLPALERAAFKWGVLGERPLLNEPARTGVRGLVH